MRIRSVQDLRCLFGLVLLAAASLVHAQNANATGKALKIVVPFSAGSGTDVIARLVGKALSAQLDRVVVVENKPGAAGTVAAQAVLSEPSDGNTLMMVSSAYAVLPASGRRLPFKPESDFEALAIVARSPNVLIASKASGFKTVADLVSAGRTRSDGLTFASSGVGSGTHLNAEYFASVTNVRQIHIPMRGGPEIIGEIVGGRVDFAFVPPSQIASLGSDKFTALGVTAKERLRSMPDVSPIADAGYGAFEYYLWYALLTKSGTSAVLSEQLAIALRKAIDDPTVTKGFETLAIEPMNLMTSSARAFVRAEILSNQALVKDRGLKLGD